MKKISKIMLSALFCATCLGTVACSPESEKTNPQTSEVKTNVEGIIFSGETCVYDGNSHSLEVTGLPNGVNVTYENNDQVNAGTYEVIAKLTDTTGKYNIPSQLKATLNINKKVLIESDFIFESKEVTYDGQDQYINLLGLPNGVSATYENNGSVGAGTYEVIAHLTDYSGNYEVPSELKTTLKINKKVLTENDFTFESKEVTYDGQAHSLEVSSLPSGVNVSYDNNSKTNAGDYEVIAKLRDNSGNYEVPSELKATLRINKKEITTNDLTFASKTVTYDGQAHSLEVTGLPEGVTVAYENNGKIDVGTYEVVAKLEDTTGNYIVPAELKSTLKINKKGYDSNDIKFESKEVTYDGNAHSLEVEGLPEGVNVTYENNNQTDAGEYEVIAKLTDTTGNYDIPAELKATLTINKKEIKASDLTFNSKTVTYDGNTHSLELTGLPTGVNVTYENNNQTDVGEYEVIAKLTDTTGNYIVPAELKSNLIINKIKIALAQSTINLNYTAEKLFVTPQFTNILTGVDVSYNLQMEDSMIKEAKTYSITVNVLNDIYELEENVLTVVVTKELFTVTFKNENYNDAVYEVYFGDDLVLNNPPFEKTGYNPIYDVELDTLVNIRANKVVNVIFEAKKFKLTYNLGIDTSVDETIDVYYDQQISLSYLNLLGYEFVGYAENDTTELKSSSFVFKYLDDVKLYAKYKFKYTYTLSSYYDSSTSSYVNGIVITGLSTYGTNIKDLNIPAYGYVWNNNECTKCNVVSIQSQAFYNNTNITTITFPKTLKSIGEKAFYGCKNVYLINYDVANASNNTTNAYLSPNIGLNVYNTSGLKIVLGENVESIPTYFLWTSYVTEIDASNATSLKTINKYAFAELAYLTKAKLSNSIETIGEYTFYNNKLMELDMSVLTNLKTIDTYAFYSCKALDNITIGENVTSIGKNAFTNCTHVHIINYDAPSFKNTTTTTVLPSSIGSDVYATDGLELKIGSHVVSLPNYFINNSYLTKLDASYADSLTNIGDYAFASLSYLTKIELPDTIETIGENAFYNNKLMELDMSVLVNLTSIGTNAFYACKALDSITIGENVTSVGKSVFFNCTNVKIIYFNAINLVPTTTSVLFNNVGSLDLGLKVIIGNKVEVINNYVFSTNTNLSTICITEVDASIAGSLKTIGDCAFAYLSNLAKIELPDTIETIGVEAFKANNLMELDMSVLTNLKTIGDYAFYACKKLDIITIGEKVTSIGNYAFVNCSNVYQINYDAPNVVNTSSLINIFANSIGSNVYSTKGLEVIIGSHVVSIPNRFITGADITNLDMSSADSLETIGESAFAECTLLTTIVLPSTLETIGASAFNYCSALTTIVLSSTLKTIGANAFYYCFALTTITLYNSIKTIGDSAFYSCNKLTTVYYYGTSDDWDLISIGSNNSRLTSATRVYKLNN